jgi:hypothetical protein
MFAGGRMKVSGQRNVGQTAPSKAPRSMQRAVASVLAVAAAGATIYGLYRDKRVAVLAFIGMFFAIALLLIMQRAIREVGRSRERFYDILVKIIVVFVVLYFMSISALLLPAVLDWLRGNESSPAHRSSNVGYNRDLLDRSKVSSSLRSSASSRLNMMFRDYHGWFCFPDNNTKMIGIKRVPDNFTVESPLNMLDMGDDDKETHPRNGDSIPFGSGATGHLDYDVADDDCPGWQREANLKWQSDKQSTLSRIDNKLLDRRIRGQWWCHPRFSFAVKADLEEKLELTFPFTSADGGADHLKYGVGESVPPSSNVTLWLGTDLLSSDCPSAQFVFPEFGPGKIESDLKQNNDLDFDFDVCDSGKCIGNATKILRMTINRSSTQGYAMLNFIKISKNEFLNRQTSGDTLSLKISVAPPRANFIEVKLFDDPKRPIFFACPTPTNSDSLILSLSPQALKKENVNLAKIKYFGIGASQNAGSLASMLRLTVSGVTLSPLNESDTHGIRQIVCERHWL